MYFIKIVVFKTKFLYSISKMRLKRQLTRTQTALDSIPYGTIQEISYQFTTLTLSQMDNRFIDLNFEIVPMFQLAFQIKTTILAHQGQLKTLRQYIMRLNKLISLIFIHFGIEGHHYQRLINSVQYCANQWKIELQTYQNDISSNALASSRFLFKTERNIYLISLLQTANTLFSKNSVVFNNLSQAGKKYLQKKGIHKYCQNVFSKIKELNQQKEQETPLKIKMYYQIAKYLIFYLKICNSFHSPQIFNYFLQNVKNSCRILRKFTAEVSAELLQNIKSVTLQGLLLYASMIETNNFIFAQKIKNISQMFSSSRITNQFCQAYNQDSFSIKLIKKILLNWKNLHQKAIKNRKNSQQQIFKNIQNKNQSQKYHEKQDSNTRRSDLKTYFTRLRKVHSTYLPKKQSQQDLVCDNNQLHPVKIRKILENEFGKLNQRPKQNIKFFEYPNLKRSNSQFKAKKLQPDRQLIIEEYLVKVNRPMKVIPNLNKIKVFKAEKMAGYCKRKQGRLRISII